MTRRQKNRAFCYFCNSVQKLPICAQCGKYMVTKDTWPLSNICVAVNQYETGGLSLLFTIMLHFTSNKITECRLA